MFDLEKSIAEWRRQMIAGGIKSRAVLDELESHLREDVEQRMRSGTPVEKAFEEAVQQVGQADQLKLEFGKVELPRTTVSPRLINRGCVAMGVFVMLTGMWLLFDVSIAEKVLGFAWLTLAGAYTALLPRLNRNILLGVRGWALRKAIAVACSFFFMAWIAVLLLDCTHVVNFSLGVAVIPNLILWPLTTAAMATYLVLCYATDETALGLWSPAAQQCLATAEQEACGFHHNFIGTEHVLLGLLKDENSCVSKVLGNMGVRSETVRAEIGKMVGAFPQSHPVQTLPYTPRAKKALSIAISEAKAMRRDRVDSEHVFLGLIREGSGVAALVLKKLGVNVWDAREEILRT
ncbi:MAG TPA: Clp protease N-terminal domain-containing protein [Verrucomicrobiae bacterium]|nr:Clp protease N-terminal domain-containing protein [Verrucomicrobiae bacterium]